MMQVDTVVFDYLKENNIAEQRVVVENNRFNQEPDLYKIAYSVKSPKVPEIVSPKTEYISPVIDNYIYILKNGSIDERYECLNQIYFNELNKSKNPAQYFDTSLMDALFDLLNEDTKKLAGPTPKQLRLRKLIAKNKKNNLSIKDIKYANLLSEREKVERNKSLSFSVIVDIQNSFYSEFKKRTDLIPTLESMYIYPKLLEMLDSPDKDKKAYSTALLLLIRQLDISDEITELLEKKGMFK